MTTTINASTSSGLVNTADTSGILQLQTASTAALTIDASQNVGIGTATPVVKLHVVRSDPTSILAESSGNTASYLGLKSTSGEAYVGTTSNGVVFLTSSSGTERMRIDSSGNLLVGTTSLNRLGSGSPSTAVQINATNGPEIYISTSSTTSGDSVGSLNFGTTGASSSTKRSAIIGSELTAASGTNVSGNLVFYTNNAGSLAERMRINSSGNVGIGTTSPDAQLHVVGQIRSSGSIAQAIYVYGAASVAPYITINQFGVRAWDIGAGTYSSGTFSIQSGGANGVYLGGTATSWASASDERIKDIIEPISNALTKVDGLRSVIGKYKTDEEGVRRSFLIAQDIQTQFPEALESSDSERLGVQYTDVIPLLVASIKELKAINDTQAETINALTARIVALEK